MKFFGEKLTRRLISCQRAFRRALAVPRSPQ